MARRNRDDDLLMEDELTAAFLGDDDLPTSSAAPAADDQAAAVGTHSAEGEAAVGLSCLCEILGIGAQSYLGAGNHSASAVFDRASHILLGSAPCLLYKQEGEYRYYGKPESCGAGHSCLVSIL